MFCTVLIVKHMLWEDLHVCMLLFLLYLLGRSPSPTPFPPKSLAFLFHAANAVHYSIQIHDLKSHCDLCRGWLYLPIKLSCSELLAVVCISSYTSTCMCDDQTFLGGVEHLKPVSQSRRNVTLHVTTMATGTVGIRSPGSDMRVTS